jgi:hypothetical protein
MNYLKEIDYSSLSTYMSCPREFLFHYIMHLNSTGKSIHLVFGSCWHYGLESSYKLLMKDPSLSPMDCTINSIKEFNHLWSLEGAPLWKDEDLIFPKSPGHAANMYKAYWDRFHSADIKHHKIIAVEMPFAIDLSIHESELPIYKGRIDLILSKDSTSIDIIDHKTAKAIYKTTPQTYEMSFQTDGYLTAGRMFYDKIPSITYRIALCQKSKIDFQPILINKRSNSIEHFLANLIHYTKEIKHNLHLLEQDKIECKDRADILKSFPRCPGYACTTFMSTCIFYDLCNIRNNPLLWLEKPPQGFTYLEWNPELIEEQTKKRLSEIK